MCICVTCGIEWVVEPPKQCDQCKKDNSKICYLSSDLEDLSWMVKMCGSMVSRLSERSTERKVRTPLSKMRGNTLAE